MKLICIDSGANGGICVWDLKTQQYTLEKLTGDTMDTLKPVLDKHFAVTADIQEVVIERPPRFMGTMIPSARIAVLFEAFGITLGYLAAKNLRPLEVTPVECNATSGMRRASSAVKSSTANGRSS